jgi:hypothetical protein
LVPPYVEKELLERLAQLGEASADKVKMRSLQE